MKTITETKTLYKFAELSREAQTRALTKWGEIDMYPWYNDNENTLNKFVEHFDFISGTRWSYGSCIYSPYGECEIDTPYHYENLELEDLAGVRLYTFIQNYMDKFVEHKVYYKGNSKYSAEKKHQSKTKWSYENDCQLTGYWADCEIMQPIFEYLENFPKYQDKTLGELMNECIMHWAVACDGDNDYYFSQEYLEERSEEYNEYYYEDGTFYGEIIESEIA